ncbi:MAG: hypothetical protein IPO78_00615 [Saprospiraceae bacterium]|nr:hypothetical protein [Saprospiraceae bacterium]
MLFKKAAEQKAKERKEMQKAREKAKKNKQKSKSTPTEAKKEASVPESKTKTTANVVQETKKDNSKITNEGSWLFPHYPAFWEGAIWAGKNLIERGKPYEAEQLFKRVDNDPLAPKSLKGELYASFADLYVKTGKYEQAIQSLKLAIDNTKSKKVKSRYAYIVGQLYQRAGRIESSNQYFAQCIKWKPGYDLSFHAKMNLFLNDATEGAASEQVIANIQKLLKDPKNKDYQGELYYSLAIISLKQNKKEQAVDQFNLSLQSPNVTNSQKADSYSKLADLYFDQQDYLKAKLYYDSTLNVLTKNDERRGSISRILANLEEIAQHLQNISLQDSMLKIAALSVKDKRAYAIQLKNAKKQK